MHDRKKMIEQVDYFFNELYKKPEEHDVDELIVLVEAIIPVHAALEIQNFDDVDTLLAVYPYLHQKLVRLYAYFIHRVRVGTQHKDKTYADIMRAYRDPLEQLLRAVRLQYDSLSRRITNQMERRG